MTISSLYFDLSDIEFLHRSRIKSSQYIFSVEKFLISVYISFEFQWTIFDLFKYPLHSFFTFNAKRQSESWRELQCWRKNSGLSKD